MRLTDIPAGETVFVDANILIFALSNHPTYGFACNQMLDRVEKKEINAAISTHTVGEVIHRMMTIEAVDRFNWPVQGIANRLRRHPNEVQQLVRARQSLDEINAAGVEILSVTTTDISDATDMSRQYGFLYGDALIVAVMQQHHLTCIASLDADFDRIAGLIRYEPT